MCTKNQSKKTKNKAISALSSIILVLTVFLCLFVAIQVLSKGYVSIAGHSFFRVVTGSMSPSIEAGSLIHTQKEDIKTIEVEDVISFRSKSSGTMGKIITHRVVGKTIGENGEVLLQTKGDANLSMDGEYVTKDNYIGTVVWCSQKGSFASSSISFLTSKSAFLICIAFPCLLICGFILKDCVRKITKDVEAAVEEIERIKSDEPKSEEETKEMSSEQQRGDDKLFTQEEYEEMYRKLRDELIEELKQSEEQEQSKR